MLSILDYFDEYCPTTGNISSYLNQVEQFFIMNDIAQSTQKVNAKQFYLTPSKEKMYRILEDLCEPKKMGEKSYEEIKHLL